MVIMEKGHFGEYTGNARCCKTSVNKRNYRSSVADDAAHIHYLEEDMKYDKKHHSPFKQIDEREGIKVQPFMDPKAPPGFESSMGENYDEEEASRMFFDDVRKADRAVNILQNVYEEGTSGLGYSTGGALNVLTGGPTSYNNYPTRIENLRSLVDSNPRQVLSRINRNISMSGSDAAMDVAKEIDPTGRYADKSMYGQTRHYSKDAKQYPRFSSIEGKTRLERQ